MTSPANGQQPSFQVTLAGQAQQTIKESHQYAAELLAACAIVPPVIVHYGVHQEEPLVIIRHVRFLG